ncbi:flagellar basal-body rod protein FlgG [Rhodovibrio sodomensis]|uniref:Flagellar basal-body rod protein FlgG n=1 Tax=Rhodovibrio sodomensis TaxID=1088 RepID=A0ABS1DII9_9PROT|nr:flagellar basal-body rod protein FlgG [Rhodovibrio sodomensis]MBK1669548.1 flagellar basal-body rod protein FlgG [Rhodovibrio sodomensis]
MQSLNIAATGMLAQQMNVEVIANNIANMNTTGYKRQRAEFSDLLYQDHRRAGANSSDAGTVVPSGIQLGLGVKPEAVYRISEQGSIEMTDNPLDLAVNGRGMFMIEMPNGETGYSRAGAFQLSPEGDIVTPDGYRVQPGINVPPDAVGVTINANGGVWVDLEGQVEPQNVGQLELARFPNEAGLRALGDNLFVETAASGQAAIGVPGQAGFGSVLQGAVEKSNVDMVKEITNMVAAQRAYEMNSKVITASDEMMQSVSRMR